MTVDLHQMSLMGGGKDNANFTVDLMHAAPLECMEIVRRVAGKRLVCRGMWDGQAVYAKLFLGNKARRYAERDASGVRALDQAGILTPALLHAGPASDHKAEVLLFAAIADADNAEDVWHGLADDSQGRLKLALSLVAAVAEHHQAELIQTDLYLKNFLLQGEQVYTLDGDAIRQLRQCKALDNLALLLSKFDVSDIAIWLPELLAGYAKARGWNAAPDMVTMNKCITAHRRGMVGHYADKKVFRQCSDIEVERDFYYFFAIARAYFSEGLRFALDDPDKLLDEPAKRLKSGNTCTVSLAEVDDRKVVVKRYNIKSFWHGLNRALRPTRAAVSWANAHRLRMYGIATAAPIALLEKRFGIIRRQAYFLAEYIDAPDAAEFFADSKVSAAQKDKLAGHIAELFHKLFLLRIAHGDFKAGNMKIVDGRPLLLDLDSLREYRCGWLFDKRHVRDLRRFMRNWQHDMDVKSRLAAAFLATYNNARLLDMAGMTTTPITRTKKSRAT